MGLLALFNSMDLEAIHSFVANGEIETLHLDFKTVKDASLKSADDRKNLAKAVSGFANSDGGLIVWGVDCRRNSDDIDCASELKPISCLSRFVSRLEELTGEASSPRLVDVRHKAIHLSSEDRGFAVSLIPEGDGGPYMAGLTETRYYKRSGGAFYRMEHFDVADMFGRRRRPDLRIVGKSKYTISPDRVSILIAVKNVGRGTAVAPYLQFEPGPYFTRSHFGFDGNCNEGMTRRLPAPGLSEYCIYAESSNFVIHPGVFVPVAEIRTADGGGVNLPDTIPIRFSICAEGVPLRTGMLQVQPYLGHECES